MPSPTLSLSRRVRSTPFSGRLNEWSVESYTVYNRTLLPTVIDSVEVDYRHLKDHVQVWDVSCERLVEIYGSDASRFIQFLTPRDLSGIPIGKCWYTPMVDDMGGMLNDPVSLRLADDRYWVSLADSDLFLWCKGLAYGLGLNVDVYEPDVSTLAVQGPKAEDLVCKIFGAGVRSLSFFHFCILPFRQQNLLIARSGYSRQGGFEIYIEGTDQAEPLWDELFKLGKDLNVRVGAPNLIERIEAGFLSYGNDMTQVNNPYECGLGKYCQPETVECIGREALLKIAEEGPTRQIRSIAIDGEPLVGCENTWGVVVNGEEVGFITSAAWSPDFKTNVAIGMIRVGYWDDGTQVQVETPSGLRTATIKENSFI